MTAIEVYMKKVIIIAMLLSLLCVCGLSAGVCFADEATSSQAYYFEKSATSSHLVLRDTASDEGKILLYIPHSYAFEKLEDANNGFVKVKYNGKEGYIAASDFAGCKAVSDKWESNPLAYDLSGVSVTATPTVTPYTPDMNPYDYAIKKEDLTITTVYGYRIKDGEYYFLVDATAQIFGTIYINGYYIKASDTSRADFNESTIPESAGYRAQKAAESVSNGDNAGPTGDPTGAGVKDSTNAFERYILIAVIAVLCVVIIILIFAPTRKRR